MAANDAAPFFPLDFWPDWWPNGYFVFTLGDENITPSVANCTTTAPAVAQAGVTAIRPAVVYSRTTVKPPYQYLVLTQVTPTVFDVEVTPYNPVVSQDVALVLTVALCGTEGVRQRGNIEPVWEDVYPASTINTSRRRTPVIGVDLEVIAQMKISATTARGPVTQPGLRVPSVRVGTMAPRPAVEGLSKVWEYQKPETATWEEV